MATDGSPKAHGSNPCCNGIAEMNAKLRDYNATLVTNLFGPVFTTVATCKIRDGVRAKKPPIVIASFCPFCGTRYEGREKAAPPESGTERAPGASSEAPAARPRDGAVA